MGQHQLKRLQRLRMCVCVTGFIIDAGVPYLFHVPQHRILGREIASQRPANGRPLPSNGFLAESSVVKVALINIVVSSNCEMN